MTKANDLSVLFICFSCFTVPATSQTVIQGEVCDETLVASWSPYILSQDVIIPDGCSLTIEEGVEVYGVDYNLTCLGSIYVDGSAENRCVLSVKNFINHSESLTMNYCDVSEYETHDVLAFLSSSAIVEFANNLSSTPSSDVANFANSANGEYFQDFNSGAGWTANQISSTGTYSITNYYENGQYLIGNPGTNASGSGCNSITIYSAQYSISEMEIPLSMDISFGATTGSSINVSMSINNGPYESIGSVGSPPSPGNYSFDIEVLESTEVDKVQFQFQIPWCGFYGQIAINSFDLITNFSVDENGYSLGEALAEGVSTSGGVFNHCKLDMDNFIVSDQVHISLDNVVQTNSSQSEASGLEIYCQLASNLILTCSEVTGFGDHGLSFFGPGNVEVKSSQISNNSKGGIQIADASFSSMNSSFSFNEGYGVALSGSAQKTIDFSNACFNNGVGLRQTGGTTTISNSIFWSNDQQEFVQVANEDGLVFIDFSCVQGGLSYGLAGEIFDLGSSIITTSPLFEDGMKLGEGSPCIDAANSNIQDSCLPPAAGSLDADIGMFGGENCQCLIIPGCIDIEACNYDASANQDDGSCLFIGSACDDGNGGPANNIVSQDCICEPINGCMDLSACNYEPSAIVDDGSCLYTCCPGPGCCYEGTLWDSGLQQCVVANPSDSNFDGCVQLNDLLDLLSAYGDCGAEESAWQCGDPLEYQGYDYETVQIGEQCWFAENLRAENYRNGEAVSSQEDWGVTTMGAQVVYDFEVENLTNFGRLYNWYAVEDNRSLCPEMWRVPADEDWDVLVQNIVEEGGVNASLKADSLWCCEGNGNDAFGFDALPAGAFNSASVFYGLYNWAYWWTSSIADPATAWRRSLHHSVDEVGRYNSNKQNGFSIRCIKDAE